MSGPDDHPDDAQLHDDGPPTDYELAPDERIRVGERWSYFRDSKQPLTILAFLLPLVLVYEFGAWRFLGAGLGGDGEASWAVSAHRVLSSVFEVFGVVGLHLPAAMLVIVLLVWHVLSREPWRLRPVVLGGMAIESAALAIPLIVLAALLAPQQAVPALATQADLASLQWPARFTISLGAGLYEELLFRMIGIAALHFVAADLLRLPSHLASVAAVGGSALVFALYHDVPTVDTGLFYFAAGLYFGLLYVTRGFGIVVACHAAYDLVALVLGPATLGAPAGS